MKIAVEGESAYCYTNGRDIDPDKASIVFVHGSGMDLRPVRDRPGEATRSQDQHGVVRAPDSHPPRGGGVGSARHLVNGPFDQFGTELRTNQLKPVDDGIGQGVMSGNRLSKIDKRATISGCQEEELIGVHR